MLSALRIRCLSTNAICPIHFFYVRKQGPETREKSGWLPAMKMKDGFDLFRQGLRGFVEPSAGHRDGSRKKGFAVKIGWSL
jgi:hypothetical protein